MVISTKFSNKPVTITESSKIVISEEVAAARREKSGLGPGLLSVSYEDVGGLKNEVNKVREI